MPASLSGLTELPGSLDVDVVVATADADNDAQSLELLQVLSSEGDGVVHHGTDRLVQHLGDIGEMTRPCQRVIIYQRFLKRGKKAKSS